MKRSRRFPLFRLGLLLVVGAMGASVVRFYTGFAERAADLNATIPSERSELWPMFRDNYLFAGSAAGWLFWGGITLMMLGIFRVFARPR